MRGDSERDSYYLEPRVAEAYDGEARGAITSDDVPFYLHLAREAGAAGSAVLELACGTGRVTIPIAEDGVPVVGLDRSPAMLAVARRKTAGSSNPRWVQADMAGFRLDERFGLVIIPFRSFLHLTTVAEQRACLDCVREHLIEGGRLALNFFNPELVILAARLASKRGPGERTSPAALGPVWRRRWSKRELRGGTLEPRETHPAQEPRHDKAIISKTERGLRLRYVFRHEMEGLLALSGLEVEGLYGWFDRRPFADDSSEMVWVARKAAGGDEP